MKSFEQLAKSAYEAYLEEGQRLPYSDKPMPTWEQLGPGVRACFVAATKRLWAEFASVQ